MDVLFIAKSDYANVAHNFAGSLRRVGVTARAVKSQSNPRRLKDAQAYNYKNMAELRNIVKGTKVIVWMHSYYTRLNPLDLTGKFLAVFHGGTPYRNSPQSKNALFNPRVDITLIQSAAGSMLGRGAKNECLIFPAVDTGTLIPHYSPCLTKVRIAHFPGKGKKKGTQSIKAAIATLSSDPSIKGKFEFLCDKELIPWQDNLRRVAGCDIYIDQQYFGGWGVSTLEAAALGKIVVSGFNHLARYSLEYGNCPIIIAGPSTLYQTLRGLLLLSWKERFKLQQRFRYWVESYHSYEATGARLKKVLEL